MDQPLSVSNSASGLEPANSAKKRRHRWIWVIILLLFGLLFFWVYKQHSASTAVPAGGNRRGGMAGPVPVTLATATKGSIGVYLNAIGTVTPVYTDTITSQVTGVITAVHFREGQAVQKGDPLIDIDSRPYEAQLEQAQGTLERDQNMLAEAQMDQKRYQDAWAKNAIPRQTLEDQEKVVMQDQGTVMNDEGTVQYDTVEVGYCHIKSPINGRVGLRLVDPGNLVTANSSTALLVVTQIQPVTVIFTLAEDSLPQVMQQMKGGKALEVDAYDRTQQKLLAKGKLSVGEEMYLDALSDLVASYEDVHYPIEPASDADMLRHLMEAKGVTQADVHRDTGLAKSSISEVLAGRKPFSRQMIHTLADYFKVDVGVFAANI